MSERIKLRFIQLKPNPSDAATMTGVKLTPQTAYEIAEKLITQNNGRSLRTIGTRIANFSSEYFQSVSQLPLNKQANHISGVAHELSLAGAIIFQKQ